MEMTVRTEHINVYDCISFQGTRVWYNTHLAFFCYRGGSPEPTSTPLFPHNIKTANTNMKTHQNIVTGYATTQSVLGCATSQSVLGCATSQQVHGSNQCMCMEAESACAWKQGYIQTYNFKRQTVRMGVEKQKKKKNNNRKQPSYSQYLRAM